MRRRVLSPSIPVVVLMLAALAVPAVAEEDPSSRASILLDRLAVASGGKAALDRISNRVTEVSTEFVAQGMTLTSTVHAARPNLLRVVTESPAIGRIEKGFDGETAWESSTMTGPRILEGDERAQLVLESTLDRVIRWRDLYEKAEATGADEVAGRPCDNVVVTPRGGKPQTWCLDRETGLLAKAVLTVESPMGAVPVTTEVGDYRAVDGVQIPFRSRVLVLTQERLVTVKSVKHGVEIAPETFAVPPDVRALIEKKKAAAAP